MDWSKIAAFNMAGKEVVKVYDNVHEKTLWEKVAVQFLTLTANNSDNTISLASVADTDVEYKVDDGEWTAYNTATTLSGAKIQMRAVNKSKTPVTFTSSTVTGTFDVSGQLDSILDWKKLQANKASAITHDAECFASMFYYNTNINSASGLVLPSIDTLPNKCYYRMFSKSSIKTSFKSITAKVFGDSACQEMFAVASGLTGTFAIENAETIGAYAFDSMFDSTQLDGITENTFAKLKENSNDMSFAMRYMLRATNVSTVMKTLPIQKIGKGMYQNMFTSSQKLTTAPEIKATGYNFSTGMASWTEGAMAGMFDNCQYLTSVQDEMYMTEACGADFMDMFHGCTRLVKGTKFTALTTIRQNAGYVFDQTYQNCTSLTSNIDLPSTLEYGSSSTSNVLYYMMQAMFMGCTSLVTPPEVPTFKLRSDSTMAVTSGTFKMMFSGCTKLAAVPSTMDAKLVKLYQNEMWEMFSGCTSITSIPANYLKSYTQAETGSAQTFASMFEGCTALISIGNNLFGTWNCNANASTFYSMFYGCTSLTVLPDTFGTFTGTVSTNTFYGMFYNCTSLKRAKGIDTTGITLAQNNYSFQAMFYYCSALTETSIDLSNVAIDASSYGTFLSMFQGCSALKEIPFKFGVGLTVDGKNTNLFNCMYFLCSSITEIPEGLFADSMTRIEASNCFRMFSGCVKLYYVPQNLLAKVTYIGSSGCESMFEGCVILAEPVVINATSFANSNDLKRMYCNTGIYMSETADQEYATPWVAPANCTAMTEMFLGSEGKWADTPTSGKTYYLRQQALGLVSESGTDFTFTTTNEHTLQTSTDNCTWTDYTTGNSVSSANGRLYVRGKNNDAIGDYNDQTHFFKLTATVNDIDVSGVSTSLLKYNINPTNIEYGDKAFYNLFNTQMALKDVSGWRINEGSVPDTSTYVYGNCFYSCSNITNAMKTFSLNTGKNLYQTMFYLCKNLATFGVNKEDQAEFTESSFGLYQCWLMFQNCYALKKAAKMNATSMDIGSLAGMYYGCTSLVDASDTVINVTDVPQQCMFNFFNGCSALTKAPTITIKNIVGANGVYGMFSSCINLIDASSVTITGVISGEAGAKGVFYNCSKLQVLPKVTITGVTGAYGMQNFFYACRELVYASSVQISGEVGSYAYANMFQNCWLLRVPPTFGDITCTTSGTHQFNFMFRTCLSLETTPDISKVQNYTTGCFQQMFYECSSLKEITWKLDKGAIPNLACYQMFYYCNTLAKVPVDMLPATTLGTQCYQQMFQACVYLHTVPNLPATTVPEQAYRGMFQDTYNLLNLPTISATSLGDNACYQMFLRSACQVSTTQQGEFTNALTLKATTVGTNALSNMFQESGGTFTGTPTGTQTLYYKKTSYVMFKSASGATVTFKQNTVVAKKLQTSTDNITYTDYVAGTAISGTQVWVRGIGNTVVSYNTSTAKICNFVLSDSASKNDIKAYGNINALLDYSDNTNNNLSMGASCFRGLFSQQNALNDINYLCLPNEIVPAYAYAWMFQYTNLANVTNTSLPAEAPGEYAYKSMFLYCTALTKMEWRMQIYAKTVSAYMGSYMFQKCTAMTSMTSWLFNHVRTMNYQAYIYAFSCTAINSVTDYFFARFSDISFVDDSSGCFPVEGIFAETKITTIPAQIFRDIGSGTAVYGGVFKSITTLTTITAGAFDRITTLREREFVNAFAESTTLTVCQATFLHLTSIVKYAFWYLFNGCTALTKPIAMPNATYATLACSYMYNGCTNIKMSATKTGDYTNEWKIEGTAASDSFTNFFTGTGGTYTNDPTINTTYYYAA